MCRLSWNLGTSTCWNPQGLSRAIQGFYGREIVCRKRKEQLMDCVKYVWVWIFGCDSDWPTDQPIDWPTNKQQTKKRTPRSILLPAKLTLKPLTWKIWWAPNHASRWQVGFYSAFKGLKCPLTHILLTWRIWWAPNNASRWQMGFYSAFKTLTVHQLVKKFPAFCRSERFIASFESVPSYVLKILFNITITSTPRPY